MSASSNHKNRSYIRVGYIPLVDAAPLILAQEMGFFEQEGLRVILKQAPGWATIRDMLAQGELEASHCLAGLLFAARAGVGCLPTRLVTGLFLNTHGNAITLSKSLWNRGIHDAASLAAAVKAKSIQLPLIFGVVHQMSSHMLLLVSWLARHGLRQNEHFQMVVLPPSLMGSNMGSGHLDGFCSGEPWGSAAVLSNEGFIAATSDEISPYHVEKVLAVRESLVIDRSDEMAALNRAVARACKLCDAPATRSTLPALLAQSEYLGVREQWIANSLVGETNLGFGRSRPSGDFQLFNGEAINTPDPARLAWLKQGLIKLGHLPESPDIPVRDVIAPSLFTQTPITKPARKSKVPAVL